ncbi:MAG: TIGR00730 family Rossman fold protein [Cytophagales bacterium]
MTSQNLLDSQAENKIRQAFKGKSWNEIKSEDSWVVFKIMSEIVQGFEKLTKIGPCVSIFGSSRTSQESVYYQLAEETATMLVSKGYGVITGGGLGIMEAANKGAHSKNGKSVGLRIQISKESKDNIYIDPDKLIGFDFFFVRKLMFIKYSQGFVVFPGGFGTLDELFEALTLIQTDRIGKFPIVLVGKEFWSGLIHWIEEQILSKNQYIDSKDQLLLHVVDSSEEATQIIESFYEKYMLKPNF